MRPEYIHLTKSEKEYGEKQLLHTQLEILNILKHTKNYQELRSEEFALKIKLKEKIEEALKSIELLEKLLPKPTIKPKNTTEQELEIHKHHHKKENLSLNAELELIKEKLSKLQ